MLSQVDELHEFISLIFALVWLIVVEISIFDKRSKSITNTTYLPVGFVIETLP
uniref:Uncharacterized protein n=1 Tax=Rhizophagus irregularis (strain DAOM 181602 / DAOM 197198 / MUCL 43194) TaxID=747089 RepID=U9TRP0_RHIID